MTGILPAQGPRQGGGVAQASGLEHPGGQPDTGEDGGKPVGRRSVWGHGMAGSG